ncbi:MAG: PQQ-dependent sugar dehydrogenase [Rhodobacteraceae bacterium]|jgi:glucose/arabinose dehydrogenase|nr:PQQ-dependent sugar dehydrogenase [uncultured Defluviimonas sp.]MCB2125295.1 PQQ-dependent sugar dehydrogenase [Paracoccaceae bacterium]MCC0068327.1 PQQ-dependent sugar dehydrogenase [Paracoccaceae bacterium]
MRATLLAAVVLAFVPCAMTAAEVQTGAGRVVVEPMATGLVEPWSLAFLPEGGFLVTERDGRLTRVDPAGERHAVAGVPVVFARGQGGLFDVLLPRDFPDRRELYLSFARPQDGGAGTALARARLDGDRLEDLAIVWQMPPGTTGGVHFGGRLAEGPEGAIYLTVGERGAFDPAQDLDALMGKVLRMDRDGRALPDNPFPDRADGTIWSYGHRNPQGLAFDAEGRLWESEHGAMGGDEINLIEPGGNYGWPVIAYGRHYSGERIGRSTAGEGVTQPAHYWDPSIAPSGHMVYSGRLWPEWAGDHFLGSLKFDYVARLDPENGWAEEVIRAAETGRVRDIREAPDGSIWFLSVDRGAVFRMRPQG